MATAPSSAARPRGLPQMRYLGPIVNLSRNGVRERGAYWWNHPRPTLEKHLIAKKLTPAAIVAAIASLSLAGVASADVQRTQPEQTGTLAAPVGHLTDPASESTHFYPTV